MEFPSRPDLCELPGRRFAHIERALAAQGRALGDASYDEMDELWNEAKEEEIRASSRQRFAD